MQAGEWVTEPQFTACPPTSDLAIVCGAPVKSRAGATGIQLTEVRFGGGRWGIVVDLGLPVAPTTLAGPAGMM